MDRALEILRSELVRTMKLLGAASLAELEPRHVTQLERLTPRVGVVRAAAASEAIAPSSVLGGPRPAR